MMRLVHNKRLRQRVLYTLCFFAGCLIDWVKGSLDGRAQMTATNITGIVVAIIILSTQDFKVVLKSVFAVWLILCIIAIPICNYVILPKYPYKGQFITAVLNIVVYGFIIIELIPGLVKGKNVNGVRFPVLIGWLGMQVLMLFSINENIWPIWYAVVFGIFYLIKFDKDTEKILLQSIPDGIILGFFVIQGTALLFRPYDVIRYTGLYINSNFNALFYLMTYAAFLCKWFFFKEERKRPILRAIVSMLAASMYGFCIYTGSKSAILAMLTVTVPFSVMMVKHCKRKVLSFVGCWMLLGLIGVMSVPIVYVAIRYMPTMHLHPLYFEGEYSIYKIQPGEPRDSEKYISFEIAMEKNAGRIFYLIPNFRDCVDSFLVLKVQAAEPEEFEDYEYIFSEEEVAAGVDPVDLRIKIHRYYFERLNLLGHTNDYKGAPVDSNYTAPHAHNVFIQMAFLYGIPAGIMFVLMIASFIPGCISLIKEGENYKVCVISCFVLAFVIFGFFEIDWMCGQLPFTMVFLLFRYVVRKSNYSEDIIVI